MARVSGAYPGPARLHRLTAPKEVPNEVRIEFFKGSFPGGAYPQEILMERQETATNAAAHFLYTKSVFLLTSSIGKATAESLVTQATTRIGRSPAMLATTDIVRLAAALEPDLASLVGIDKAKRLSSALRVMVGGNVGLSGA